MQASFLPMLARELASVERDAVEVDLLDVSRAPRRRQMARLRLRPGQVPTYLCPRMSRAARTS
eukprot:4893608-Pyramimonas_sp.AAC.1